MAYVLRASWSSDCVPQTPIEFTQGVGAGVSPTETETELETRFNQAVRAAKAEHPADPPGTVCP